MKRVLCLCLVMMCFVFQAEAENYIVMSDDERVLVSKDAHEQRSIASITKIMTAVLCLEKGDYIDQWNVGEEVSKADEKRIYLVEGQMVSMRSLLYGLMLESGNDAALVLAKRVGGSVENFVKMMNEKAKEIGMLNTVFHNPHGLDVHEQGNLSTCFDMALLMKYALNNEQFCEIIKTKIYASEWGTVFHNSNKLLSDFAFCLGGKTGYTSKAGRTLVTAAKNQDLTAICVSFQIQDHFEFHKSQYIDVLNKYQKYTLLHKGDYLMTNGTVRIEEPFCVTCTLDELSQAQIRYVLNHDTVTFQFTLNDYVVSKTYPIVQKKNICFLGWCF
ncbi:MAG: D-alanyl-D-alanine carboxypeptidase [Erysipelotrichaceae bacterium]|nr:D-alanyl-D-alanine carboxypeptidase [Erysipelotrichaceae bacterium]